MQGYTVGYLETGLYPLITGFCAIIFALIQAYRVVSKPRGTDKMNELSDAIQEGAHAFLKTEFFYLSFFIAALYVLISAAIDWRTGICYLVGAFTSGCAGFIGMMISTRANIRTTQAARTSLNDALVVSFSSGSVMGFMCVGLALTSLSVLYLIFDDNDSFSRTGYIPGFGMGASSVSIFNRVGGGIYTKAADVGADLVGKLEADIPEDDARNPATIADNVGDNVGDVAGMGADIYGSFAGSIIACCLLGMSQGLKTAGIALPYWISASGVLASAVGVLCVRTNDKADQKAVLRAITTGVYVAGALQLGFMAIIIHILGFDWKYYAVICIGLVAGRAIGFSSEYFTSYTYAPTQSIARAGRSGPASVIIQGLSVGMLATVAPGLIIAATVLGCVNLVGFYGIALASVGLLSNLGVTLATDAFGPVADNAGGIAEMSELPPEVRERTDLLDALGNTTAAVGKGFAMGSAVLTGLALLTSYVVRVGTNSIDIVGNLGYAMAGSLVGAMIPFAFGAVTMGAVAEAAQGVVYEVRRQFRTIPGIMERKAKPDYAACVGIVTRFSLAGMVIPALIVIFPPLIIGIGLGPHCLGGMLASSIVCSFVLGLTMSAAGGAWDNAKKYCEAGLHGGHKKDDVHKACIVGDTVGDPFKDTSGPSLNILVKLSTYMGVVLAPIYKEQPNIWWVGLILLGIISIFIPFWVSYVSKVHEKAANAHGSPSVEMSNKAAAAPVSATAPASTAV